MKEPNTPTTTYSPEYIKDREKIDKLAQTMQNQILQLNKQLTIIQITDFKLTINEPSNAKQDLPASKKAWMNWIKLLGWFKIRYDRKKIYFSSLFKNVTKKLKP